MTTRPSPVQEAIYAGARADRRAFEALIQFTSGGDESSIDEFIACDGIPLLLHPLQSQLEACLTCSSFDWTIEYPVQILVNVLRSEISGKQDIMSELVTYGLPIVVTLGLNPRPSALTCVALQGLVHFLHHSEEFKTKIQTQVSLVPLLPRLIQYAVNREDTQVDNTMMMELKRQSLLCIAVLSEESSVQCQCIESQMILRLGQELEWATHQLAESIEEEEVRDTLVSRLCMIWTFVFHVSQYPNLTADLSSALFQIVSPLYFNTLSDEAMPLDVQCHLIPYFSIYAEQGRTDWKIDSLKFLRRIKQWLSMGKHISSCFDMLVTMLSSPTDLDIIQSMGSLRLFRLCVKIWLQQHQHQHNNNPDKLGLLGRMLVQMLSQTLDMMENSKVAEIHSPSSSSEEPSTITVLQLLCRFTLLSSTTTQEEGVWMLQLVSEHSQELQALLAQKCVHYLGSLYLVYYTLELDFVKDMIDLASTPANLKVYLSHIGVSELQVDRTSLAQAWEDALTCKVQGNHWFQLGDYYAARQVYGHALALLRVAVANDERQTSHAAHDFKSLSIGTNVQVQSQTSSRSWEPAMIADVNDDTVDVIYTTKGEAEEDDVPHCRIRLIPAYLLESQELQIQLLMNAAKCSAKMNQLEHVMSSCADVLELEPKKWQALYLRAITAMELGQLAQAKVDLRTAHSALSKSNPWITKAWTRLQFLMKRQKRNDRRLTKDMLRYLSTIPGLIEE